jgi:hypothetical protein
LSRREPRDLLDLLAIHDRHLRLGAVIWAAVAKEPGFTPGSLLGEIRRNGRYRPEDFADLRLAEPVDAGKVALRLRAALADAVAFVAAMPAGKEGLLFLQDGRIVQPDPTRLAACTEQAGQRQRPWPSSSDIAGAMLERCV